MTARIPRAGILAVALAVLAPCGPAIAKPHRTETPVRSIAGNRGPVKVSYVRLYRPLPKALGAPARCDWIGFLRYRPTHGRTRPRFYRGPRPGATFVAMPGLLGGATDFDSVARNIVRRGAAAKSVFEFWAIDRRANCVEDRRGIRAARRSGDYHKALGYYYGAQAIGGHRFAGFHTGSGDDLPWLSEIGLAQTVRDQNAVIHATYPRRRQRSKRVFCGGHSLGGSITGAYASWDFDGDPATKRDAGFRQCAGFFGFDTAVTNNLGGGAKFGGLKGDALYQAETEGIRSGAAPRLVAATAPLTPELFEVVGIAGLAAYFDGKHEGLLDALPSTTTIDLALKLVLSKDAAAFAIGNPRAYRLTNEALLGSLIDDNSESIAALQASLGTYDGGPVTDKDFPAPNPTANLPFIGPEIGSVLAGTIIVPGGSASKLMIPATQNGPVYGWRSYSHVGDPGAPPQLDRFGEPFTDPSSEVTSIHGFARSLFDGPVDTWEQYFPMRLLADDGAFLTGARSGDLENVRYEDGPNRRPYLELLGTEGVVAYGTSGNPEAGVEPRRRVVLEGYNHLDVTTAARKQNLNRPEHSSKAMIDFAHQVLEKNLAPRR